MAVARSGTRNTAFALIARWFSNRLTPLLPWIFLALRRAWVPTVAGLILATLFFGVPQTREVLHGLKEPVLKSLADYKLNDPAVNLAALVSYVVMAAVMGLALWYAARLLCSVDAAQGMPVALSAMPPPAQLRYATAWYPRGLGVSAVAAAIGALIYASYTPRWDSLEALILALAAVTGPLVFVTGRLRKHRHASRAQTGALYALGALITLPAYALMGHQQADKWPVAMACIVGSLVPALLLLGLVQRRVFIRRRPVLRRWLGLGRGTAATGQSFDQALVSIIVLVLASLGMLLLLTLPGAHWMRWFGSAAAVLLFLAAATLLLSGLQLLLRRLGSNVPGFTSAFVVVVAVLVATIGDEDLGDEKVNVNNRELGAMETPQSTGSATSTSVQSPASNRNLYVNAYGGGLRAAVFTAQVLAKADDQTCGEFGNQVAAFSGVSGGSLGLAIYLVARQEWVALNGPEHCRSGTQSSTRPPLHDIVTQALVQDHLSPVVSQLLAWDAPHLPGAPRRGQALLDSWDGTLTSALAEKLSGSPFTTQDSPARGRERFSGLALPLSQLTGGFANPPAVYFNATDADTGHILSFSNLNGGTAFTYHHTLQRVNLSVGQAVLHSARFPIVSPAGAFRTGDQAFMRVVDGGYADNSGTSALLDHMDKHPPANPALSTLINIDGNPDSSQDHCTNSAQEPLAPFKRRVLGLLEKDDAANDNPPLITAVRALFSVRTAHATRAAERFSAHLNNRSIKISFNVESAIHEMKSSVPGSNGTQQPQSREICDDVKQAQKAPLGWYMTYESARILSASADAGLKRICEASLCPQYTQEALRQASDTKR